VSPAAHGEERRRAPGGVTDAVEVGVELRHQAHEAVEQVLVALDRRAVEGERLTDLGAADRQGDHAGTVEHDLGQRRQVTFSWSSAQSAVSGTTGSMTLHSLVASSIST
jgi:hypothetical protein